MGSCAAPSAKGDDKFITTDYLQQCPGYRDLVQITCACVSILGLCAATGVFSYFDNKPLAFLYGCGALACFLYAVDCAIPLYMTRKKPRKQL
ncbi:cobalamin biosynthesis protein CbiX [Klebsiella pneumoniae]|uniref:cobalamin biosynthesis protein CbiX n=1 Tax=Klebsiella pneumoniae TaxID=573 RepID=UPI000AD8804C